MYFIFEEGEMNDKEKLLELRSKINEYISTENFQTNEELRVEVKALLHEYFNLRKKFNTKNPS